MVHAVLLSIALAAAATDRIVVHHAATWNDRPGNKADQTPGSDVLNATGARLAVKAIHTSVAMPIAMSGVTLAGCFSAVHIVMASLRAAGGRLGLANRSLDRAILWNRGPGSLRAVHTVLAMPAGTYMPASELKVLNTACISSSVLCIMAALWVVSATRPNTADRRTGVSRTQLRVTLAAIWALVALITACVIPKRA